MSWTTPPTLAAGTVLTASDWNIHTTDLLYLYGGVTGRLTVGTQSVPTNTVTEINTWRSSFVAGGMTASTTGLTVPVKGIYAMTVNVGFTAGTSTQTVATVTPAGQTQRTFYGTGPAGEPMVTGSDLIELTAGASVAVHVKQITGVSQFLSANTWLTLALVGHTV